MKWIELNEVRYSKGSETEATHRINIFDISTISISLFPNLLSLTGEPENFISLIMQNQSQYKFLANQKSLLAWIDNEEDHSVFKIETQSI